jgi:hypothetical protein
MFDGMAAMKYCKLPLRQLRWATSSGKSGALGPAASAVRAFARSSATDRGCAAVPTWALVGGTNEPGPTVEGSRCNARFGGSRLLFSDLLLDGLELLVRSTDPPWQVVVDRRQRPPD